MKSLFIFLIAPFTTLFAASPGAEIPVRQETLGQWHYLHTIDPSVSISTQVAPTVVAFGPNRSRIAALIPGFANVAEFKNGRFLDLGFPRDIQPCSLASDLSGTLYALGQKRDTTTENWQHRFITRWNGRHWSEPLQVPFDLCDQIVFDGQNRLWALGPARTVAVRQDDAWDTFTYSDDRHLDFSPIRLATNAAGDPVLFAFHQPWEGSRMLGTLTYHNGRFVRDAHTDTSALVAAQKKESDRNQTPPTGTSTGYVGLSNRGLRPTTLLQANGYTFVSLANDGFAWSGPDDAKIAPLSIDQEWEQVPGVQFDPTPDPAGNLWILRRQPDALEEITLHETKSFPLDPTLRHVDLFDDLEFDTKGRPWLMNSGGTRFEVAVLDEGRFTEYADLASALQGESSKFQPGRILPFATKATSGAIEFGGWFGHDSAVTIIDGGKVTREEAQDIDPNEPNERPMSGHGYNPFRNADLWLDHDGFLHTAVNERGFRYADGKWSPSSLTPQKDSAIPLLPPEQSTIVALDTSKIVPLASSRTIYRGFHFYRIEDGHEKQLDTGLNPLAIYPFAYGLLPGAVDPQGRVWVAQHHNERGTIWYAERIH